MLDMEVIGNTIREVRKEKGYTIENLAKKAGYSKGALSKIERGKAFPTLEGLIILVRELGVNLSYILRDTMKKEDYQLAVIESLIEKIGRITTLNEYFDNNDNAVFSQDELTLSNLIDNTNFLIVQMDESLLTFFRDIAEAENSKRKLKQPEYERRILRALSTLHESKQGEEVNSYCIASIQDIESIIEKTVEKRIINLCAMPGALCDKANAIR